VEKELILGIHVDHRLNPDYELMKEAGIEWLQIGFSYSFRDRLRGELTERFQETIELVKSLRRKGLELSELLLWMDLKGSVGI